MTDLATNVLYYGDNLDILRRYLPDAAVDLVYLDPAFNSNRDYNVIFPRRVGQCHRCPAAGLRGHLALGSIGRGDLRLPDQHCPPRGPCAGQRDRQQRPMSWPLTAGLMAALMAFVVARIWVRRWIKDLWLDNAISDRVAADLFSLTYLAPMLVVMLIAIAANPGTAINTALLFLFVLAPIAALGIGPMDYAVQHGVKRQMLKDRETQRRAAARTDSRANLADA
jgi:hypothetical protein